MFHKSIQIYLNLNLNLHTRKFKIHFLCGNSRGELWAADGASPAEQTKGIGNLKQTANCYH